MSALCSKKLIVEAAAAVALLVAAVAVGAVCAKQRRQGPFEWRCTGGGAGEQFTRGKRNVLQSGPCSVNGGQPTAGRCAASGLPVVKVRRGDARLTGGNCRLHVSYVDESQPPAVANSIYLALRWGR